MGSKVIKSEMLGDEMLRFGERGVSGELSNRPCAEHRRRYIVKDNLEQ